jgi:hypothetical protein
MTPAEKKGLVWVAVYGLLIFYNQRARRFGDVRAAAYHIAKDFFSRNELPPLWAREVLMMEKCPKNWGRDMAIVLTVEYVRYFCEVCLFCELPPTRTRFARGDQACSGAGSHTPGQRNISGTNVPTARNGKKVS